eukprot:4771621-Alexandrium_andersonii.AAC.1
MQKRWFQCNLMCEFCFASAVDSNLLYCDARPCAGWRCTCATHQHYLLNTPPNERSTFCSVPGWRHDRIWPDIVHLIYFGVGCDVAACC